MTTFRTLLAEHPRGNVIRDMDRRFTVQIRGDEAPTPSDPCDFGTWNFAEPCQSGHLMTAGMI